MPKEREDLSVLKTHIRRMRDGDTAYMNIPLGGVQILRTFASRLNQGYYTIRRNTKKVDGMSFGYVITCRAEKERSLRGQLFEQLDQRRDRYEFAVPTAKLQHYITQYNQQNGTCYRLHGEGERTTIVRDSGQEAAQPLVDALNAGDPAKVLAAWQKLGYLVRARLLQAGMGVDISLDARPAPAPCAAKSESAADV